MRFMRGMSGHSLENISGDRLSSVVIARKGIDEKTDDWGLYAFWQDSAIKQPILTRSNIKKTAPTYHPADQKTIKKLMSANQDDIKLFCLYLMDDFCKRLNSEETVINLRDVLEDSLAAYQRQD